MTQGNVTDWLVGLCRQWLPVLLDTSIKGAVILLLAGAAIALMRRSAAASRQLVLVLAMASLLALPILSIALPGWRVLPSWAGVSLPAIERIATAPAPAPVPSPAPPTAFPPVAPESPGQAPESLPVLPEGPGAAAPVAPPSGPPAITPSGAHPQPAPPAVPAKPAAHSPQSSPALPWAMAAWALGAALCLAPLVLGRLSLWRLSRKSQLIDQGPWTALLARAREVLAFSRPVRMLESPDRTMPMIWGVFRVTLLVPSSAVAWSTQRRWVVILHELAHARRWDCAARLLAHLACAMYWFNPLCWLAMARLQEEAEAACDDLVLSSGPAPAEPAVVRPSDYAEHLLDIASGLRAGMLAAYSSIAMARRSRLEGRLLAILDPKRSRRSLTRLAALIAVVLVAGLVVPIAIMKATTPATPSTPQLRSGQASSGQAHPATGPGGAEPLNVSDRPVLALKYAKYAGLVSFSPDGRVLASTCGGVVRLTEVRTGACVRARRVGSANSMACSPDGRFLVIGLPEGSVKVLGIPTLVEEQVLPVTQWSIYALAVSRDSRLVAACAADGTVQIWDIKSARKLQTLGSKGERMASLAFSPDGKLLAALSRYGRCDIWDLATSKTLATVSNVGSEDDQIRFDPAGHILAIASRGETIRLWKYETEKAPAVVKVPDVLIGKPRINGPDFSPAEGRPMNAPLGDFACGRASISPDLRIAASTLENGRIALWDIATRQVLHILPTGHVPNLYGGGIEWIAFSPNAELLATANRTGDVEVWQLRGKPIKPGVQVTDADSIPGPWGQVMNGLRTRLILDPVKPSMEALWRGAVGNGGTIPTSEGVWWRVGLQVRNETDQKLMVVWPEIRRSGGVVVTRADGQVVEYHSLAGDDPVTKQLPIPVLPRDTSTMNSILLGRNHDMRLAGKYLIQFPQTESQNPPEGVTNPTLPASNVLEFENDLAADTQPAVPEQVVKEYLRKIAQIVPKGWKVAAEGDVITVTRDEPVEWNNGIGLPLGDKEQLKKDGFFIKRRYSIRVQIASLLTPQQLQAMREENAGIEREMQPLMGARWRQMGMRYTPETPKEKADYEQYQKLQSQLHRIPDLVTAEASVTFDSLLDKFTLPGPIWGMYYSPQAAADCQNARRLVELAFAPKDSAAIAQLIKQLGSESFQEREKAQQAIVATGRAALAALGRATADRDPERTLRAKAAIKKIREDPRTTFLRRGQPLEEAVDLLASAKGQISPRIAPSPSSTMQKVHCKLPDGRQVILTGRLLQNGEWTVGDINVVNPDGQKGEFWALNITGAEFDSESLGEAFAKADDVFVGKLVSANLKETFWSGTFMSLTEATYEVRQNLKGDLGGKVKVHFLILGDGSNGDDLWLTPDRPKLRDDVFKQGAEHLLFVGREKNQDQEVKNGRLIVLYMTPFAADAAKALKDEGLVPPDVPATPSTPSTGSGRASSGPTTQGGLGVEIDEPQFLAKTERAMAKLQKTLKDDPSLGPLAAAKVESTTAFRGHGALRLDAKTAQTWDFPIKGGPTATRRGPGYMSIVVYADSGGDLGNTPFAPPPGCWVGHTWLAVAGNNRIIIVSTATGDAKAHRRLVETLTKALAEEGVVAKPQRKESVDSVGGPGTTPAAHTSPSTGSGQASTGPAEPAATIDLNLDKYPGYYDLKAKLPAALRAEIINRCVALAAVAYPHLDAKAIREDLQAAVHQGENTFDVGHAPGIRLLVLGPKTGLTATAELPSLDIALGLAKPPAGYKAPAGPIDLAQAQKAAQAVLDRAIPDATMRPKLSDHGSDPNKRFFRFAAAMGGRSSNSTLSIAVSGSNGWVGWVEQRSLPAPGIGRDAMIAKARPAIKDFQPELMRLGWLTFYSRAVPAWEYIVPPYTPGPSAPSDIAVGAGLERDRTYWDAATGELLFSEVLAGGTPQKPHRSSRFYFTPTDRLVQKHLQETLSALAAGLPATPSTPRLRSGRASSGQAHPAASQPATGPVRLPGSGLSALKPWFGNLFVLAEATEDPHPESLEGERMVVCGQTFKVVEQLAKNDRVGESVRITYTFDRRTEGPVGKGRRVLWAGQSVQGPGLLYLGCKAAEDTPKARKALADMVAAANAVNRPGEPRLILLPGSSTRAGQAIASGRTLADKSVAIALVTATNQGQEHGSQSGEVGVQQEFQVREVIAGRLAQRSIKVSFGRGGSQLLTLPERAINKGESLIWILQPPVKDDVRWHGVKALLDTPVNRQVLRAAIVASQQSTTAPATGAAKDNAAWSKPVEGLRARLRTVYHQSSFIAGQPILVRLDIACEQASDGGGGAQLYPHVDFQLGRETKQVKLPIENCLHILKGRLYSRYFDVTELFAELKKPEKYVLAGGHSNGLISDIGYWLGDLRSGPVTIQVLADTPANWKLVEKEVDAEFPSSQAVPFESRTAMSEAEVKADLQGLDVDTTWSKDGPPKLLKLELFEKVGPKDHPSSVLIARYGDRKAPGDQSTAQVLRFFRADGDRYFPVQELGLTDVSLSPEVFEYDGQTFVQLHLEYKGGGPCYTWWLDGSTIVKVTSEDPQHKVSDLLEMGEHFDSGGKQPVLGPYCPLGEEPRSFRSNHTVYRKGKAAIINATYRLEKDAKGRPVRFVVTVAKREPIDTASSPPGHAAGG